MEAFSTPADEGNWFLQHEPAVERSENHTVCSTLRLNVTGLSRNSFSFLIFLQDDVKNMYNEYDSNIYLDEIVCSCHHLTPVLKSKEFHIFLICLLLCLALDLCLNKIKFDMNPD